MKKIKYGVDFYVGGELKYAAGSHYPVTEETALHAAQGHAEEVEHEEVKPEVKKEKAKAA